MNASAQINSLALMPHDILKDISKKLPVVNNRTPWRDLSHLGATCKGLNQWTKDYYFAWRKQHWPSIPKGPSWRAQLEIILASQPDRDRDAERRLFCEPMLRSLTLAIKREKKCKVAASNVNFWLELYARRETTPSALAQILSCLKNFKNFSRDEKRFALNGISERFLALNKLDPDERIRISDLMFAALESDIDNLPVKETSKLLSCIIRMGEEGKISQETAGKFVLKIQFSSYKRFDVSDEQIGHIVQVLSFNTQKAYRWLLDSVPRIFDSRAGILGMAQTQCGCDHMLTYYKSNLSGKSHTDQRMYWSKIFLAKDQLKAFSSGCKILQMSCKSMCTVAWKFLDPNHPGVRRFSNQGMFVLRSCLELAKDFLSVPEIRALKRRMQFVLELLSEWGQPDQAATAMLQAYQANINFELKPRFTWGPGCMKTISVAAAKLSTIPDLNLRYKVWKMLAWYLFLCRDKEPYPMAAKDVKKILVEAIQQFPEDLQKKARKHIYKF